MPRSRPWAMDLSRRGFIKLSAGAAATGGVLPSIPPDRAVQRIDAAGKLVTPGLIDLHTHLCPHLGIGLPADELVPITATTTAVSAGDAGAHTFGIDLLDGPVEFVDTRGNKRGGTRKLVPVLTVRAGRPYGRPPLPVPFLY